MNHADFVLFWSIFVSFKVLDPPFNIKKKNKNVLRTTCYALLCYHLDEIKMAVNLYVWTLDFLLLWCSYHIHDFILL